MHIRLGVFGVLLAACFCACGPKSVATGIEGSWRMDVEATVAAAQDFHLHRGREKIEKALVEWKKAQEDVKSLPEAERKSRLASKRFELTPFSYSKAFKAWENSPEEGAKVLEESSK